MTDDAQDPPRSTALALAPRGSSLELATPAWALAQRIAGTPFVPTALQGKPEAVLAAILTGHEIGVSPMQALAKIHVIEGRPAMSAELMRAVALSHGHEIWIEEQSSTRVVVGGKRKGSERETRVAWTMDDAKRANLEGRQNWKRYPSAMLLARATAALCRAIFPDVLAGISYTVEELEDGDVIDGEPGLLFEADSPAAREAEPPRARARARRAATRGAEAPAEADAPVVEKPKGEAPPLPGEEDELEPEPGSDDDVVDAEIVGEGEPPIGSEVEVEPPDETIEGEGPGPTYSGPQIVSMKANDFGLNRDEKIFFLRHLVERPIESSKDLTPDEVKQVLELFDDEDALEERWTTALASGEWKPAEEPEAEEEPKRTRRPVGSRPETWDAARWREFLRERGVKVAEVLAEGSRLAREAGSPAPTKVDEISSSGLADVLVGFVEDLSAERKGSS